MKTLAAAALLAVALTPLSSGAAVVSTGPDNVTVLEPGWRIERVAEGLEFPTSIAFRGSDLLVVEGGRYHYADPYTGQDLGKLRALAVDDTGTVSSPRAILDGLADPIGLAVAPNGDVLFSEFGRLVRVPGDSIDARSATAVEHSTGYPAQTRDFAFTPLDDPTVGELINVNTTGPMGVTVRADGQPFVAVGVSGPAPDDPIVREMTQNGYDNDYSSSVVAPRGGPLTLDQRVARGCRNCFDLTFGPEGGEHANRLFLTENAGVYRGRVTAGPGRSAIEDSTTADSGLLDGITALDLETKRLRRVATLRPDGATLGSAPTGIAFAPAGFGAHGGEMLVAIFGNWLPDTDDRGSIDVVHPDFEHGVGSDRPLVVGLDKPSDLAFGPDGALYVAEYFSGRVYRLTPPA